MGYVRQIVIFYRKNQTLLAQLTKRNIESHYKGSILGMFWALVHPLLMLAVYSFVFGVIFQSRWESFGSDSPAGFPLTLFVGLTIFNFFAETVNKSPALILNNPNFVKKVVFPLKVLSLALVGETLFHAAVSFLILLLGMLVLTDALSWTILLLPITFLPVVFLALGFSWLLSALGVFFRDIQHAASTFTMVLFFITPIFYPASMVPESFRFILAINPLAMAIDSCRRVVWGQMPDWSGLLVALIISLVVLLVAHLTFEKLRTLFADAL